MAIPSTKPSTFLLFPWGLLSIVLILILNLTLSEGWFRNNWSWITLILIIPAAILENFKVGYSTMRIMFMKVVYSLLSFLLVGGLWSSIGRLAPGEVSTTYRDTKDQLTLVCIARPCSIAADTGSTTF